MLIVLFLFLLGFILITKGADIFIDSTISVAKKTNIPEIVLGATLVSLATTFPELTVSVFASIQGHTTMSLGNAVGSIICNTGLALGLVAIIKPFKVSKNIFNSKAILLMIATITLMVLCFDGKINKSDSIILVIVLCFYMYSNYKSVPKTSTSTNLSKGNTKTKGEPLKLGGLFLIGIIMMIIGSRLLVNNGIIIAESVGVPQAVISLTVIALGTSLPELVSCLTAIKKNHNAISVGNILGANILNIVSVVAFSAIFNEIPILSQTAMVDFPFMILLLTILIVPTFIKHRLYRIQGILMLLTYITYMATLYF
ncbi:MAG: calcium/sodium antiporter, partial [Paraclostridium sp.]